MPCDWAVDATQIYECRAPQVEWPCSPVTAAVFERTLHTELSERNADHSIEFIPASLCIRSKTDPARVELLGKVEEAFISSKRPLPKNFDFSYFNAAPSDQQIPRLSGDEKFTLTNLCPPPYCWVSEGCHWERIIDIYASQRPMCCAATHGNLERNIQSLQHHLERQSQLKRQDDPVHSNKIGARRSDTFKAISSAPSINRTPRGPVMVPVAYTTVQDLSNSVGVAQNVHFNGDPAYLLDMSEQPNCTGDEKGTGGGVRSGTVNGYVKPVAGAQNVRANGKYVVRQGDACWMNGGNNPGTYVTIPVPNGPQPQPSDGSSLSSHARQETAWAEFTRVPWNAQTAQSPFPSVQENLKASLSKPVGPMLVPLDANRIVAQRLKARNNLEIALLGLFGAPGAATRLAGGSEEQVAAGNSSGAAIMGLTSGLIGVAARPGVIGSAQPAVRPTLQPAPVGGLRIVKRIPPPRVSAKVHAARERQHLMLQDDVGYNMSPLSWDRFAGLGRDATFNTDRNAITKYFGEAKGGTVTISKSLARQIEREMGLVHKSLDEGFKVRQIRGIRSLEPASPMKGNKYFQGPGAHLPVGAPELMIKPVPPTESANVRTILIVKVQ